MFGLKHCIYFNCVLNGSNSLAETDAQTLQLCPICLRKLQHSTGFDPVSRYQQLAHFYQREKLRPEEMWCERQLAKVNPP
jgi:archaemetzincin